MKKIALSLFLLSSFIFADNHDAGHDSAKPAEVKAQVPATPVKKAATTTKKKDNKHGSIAPTGEKAETKPTEGKN